MTNSARVFIARSGIAAVVVTMHVNDDDVWHEDETPAVLRAPLVAEVLGTAVASAMKQTARRTRNLRDVKASDWPAYRASGEKSIRQFERLFVAIEVEGANEANLVAVVTGSPEKDSELRVTSTVSTASPTDLGA